MARSLVFYGENNITRAVYRRRHRRLDLDELENGFRGNYVMGLFLSHLLQIHT